MTAERDALKIAMERALNAARNWQERAEQAAAELVEWKAAHARALRDREAVEREMDARWVERNGRILTISDQRDSLVDVLQGILQDPSTLMQPMRIAAAYAALRAEGEPDTPAEGEPEFPPALAAQGNDKPATNSAVETAAMRADARSHPNRPHPYCPSCVDNVIRLTDALDRERRGRQAAWGHNEVLAAQRDAARDLAAALEAELARVRDAVNVGATPALIAEILDEATDG